MKKLIRKELEKLLDEKLYINPEYINFDKLLLDMTIDIFDIVDISKRNRKYWKEVIKNDMEDIYNEYFWTGIKKEEMYKIVNKYMNYDINYNKKLIIKKVNKYDYD